MGLLLAAMVVMVFGNAAGRYLFNTGLAASEELSRLAFVWLVFLGAVIGVRERTHVGVDMLLLRLPRWGKLACLVFCNLLILYALWLLAEGSWLQTLVGLNSHSPVTGVPLAAFALAALVAAVLMGLLYVGDLFRALTGRLEEDELIQVREVADDDVHKLTRDGSASHKN
ncbi:TRAP transporter small permease [Rhizobium leguminosarum]|nr:TRAP transporter small permease [Rhizobium leguminosarum]